MADAVLEKIPQKSKQNLYRHCIQLIITMVHSIYEKVHTYIVILLDTYVYMISTHALAERWIPVWVSESIRSSDSFTIRPATRDYTDDSYTQ